METEASAGTLSRLYDLVIVAKEKVEARSKDQEDVEESLEDQEDEKSLGRYATKRPVPLVTTNCF